MFTKKIKPQKVQMRKDQLWTVKDFQNFLGDIDWLQPITYWSWSNNSRTEWFISDLRGHKVLNSPRKFSAKAERELAFVEKKLQDAHVDCLDPELDSFLVILVSTHSTTEILMQRENTILQFYLYHTNRV